MATRIFRLITTLTASQLNKELTDSPLQPPSGLKWTIVELRPFFEQKGRIFTKFDTEQYHDIDREDVLQYGKPQTVALDIVQPHKYEVRADDLSGIAQAVGISVIVEESPVAP